MTVAILIIAALALGLSAVALWVAVLARSEGITARRELSSHRRAHAENAEERRATRRAPQAPQETRYATGGPVLPPEPVGAPTEALETQDAYTRERPAVQLPRPGRIGGQR